MKHTCMECDAKNNLLTFPGGTWCKSCWDRTAVLGDMQCAATFWLDHNNIKCREHRHNFQLLVETLLHEAWEDDIKQNHYTSLGMFTPFNEELMDAIACLYIDHGYRIGFPFADDPRTFNLIDGVQSAGPLFENPKPPYTRN